MNCKLALVIPWYGEEIPGGAEAECRSLARALSGAGLPVEVLTTCAREFRSDWNRDFHPQGVTTEAGIVVRRFPVRPRDTARFDAVNRKLLEEQLLSRAEEETYLRESITSPGLCAFLDAHRNEYVFLFIPYMFGTTFWGSQVCPERSVLIPCLHDESYARMRSLRSMFRTVRGLVFHSAAEQRLAERLYGLAPDRCAVLGEPVECGFVGDAERFRRKFGLSDFLLFAGRVDAGKGADLLEDYFRRHVERHGQGETLVFIGSGDPQAMRGGMARLGFLSRQDKYDCYAAARAICVPGVMESFSLVMMESWAAGRPAIVNAGCAVTTEFCRLANAGLHFRNFEEFSEVVLELGRNRRVADAMGQQGRRFVLDRFAPDRVAARYKETLASWFA